nr:MAG TPA: minor tail protein L [Caudoviricetes sp.]
MGIFADIQQLEVGEKVELFELDAGGIGGDELLFHGYEQLGSIWWQGREFAPWPIVVEGFSKTGEGQQPSPKLTVGDIDGSISALCIFLDDLVGAKLIRHITLGRFLDAVNFPDGNPDANPDEHLPAEIWFINQRTEDDGEHIEFQLATALDLDGLKLPRRQIIANLCSFEYRGPYCGWTGVAFFDKSDQPVSERALDRCGKRISSCKCRFGEFNELPFGGFPAADLMRA